MSKLLVILALMVCATKVEAQQKPRPQLYIAIEEPDEDAVKCGVSKSQLDSIAALTFRNNGIQAANSYTNPFLHIDTVFLRTATGACTYHVRVSVRGLSTLETGGRGLGLGRSSRGMGLTPSFVLRAPLE